MQIQHSSHRDDWMTPPDIIDSARYVLGDIDLDPASSRRANEIVMAERYIDQAEDGLTSPWCLDGKPVSIYLNPPGGKVGNQSKCALFWRRLMYVLGEGRLNHAVFMAFSCEALQTTQNLDCMPIMSFPFCVPRRRIRFVDPDGARNQPSHSNAIVYVPGLVDNTDVFRGVFSEYGFVK